MRLKKFTFLSKNRKIIDEAVREIILMQDEIESLWGMLDEIKSSDIKKHKAVIEIATASKILSSISREGKDNDQN